MNTQEMLIKVVSQGQVQAWKMAGIHVDCAAIALKRGDSNAVREVATKHLEDALRALRETEPSLERHPNWMDASKDLPPEGEYVLVHLNKDNWHDRTDPKGVHFKVAKLELGISATEREKMQSGEIQDPNNRRFTYTGADEHGNNLRPYQWVCFGPGNYFGQEVDFWMRIPLLKHTSELRWHHGPTETDSDAAKMWCCDCGKRVMWTYTEKPDGCYVCMGCNRTSDN